MIRTAIEITQNLGGIWRCGRGQAPCPVCQPERHRDQNALSISEGNGKLLLFCFKGGCSFVEIANAAALHLGSVQIDFEAAREADRKQAECTADKLAKARSLWDAAKPITGTKGEAYLRARGITCPLPESLKWMTDIYHSPSTSWASAIVADVQPTGGVHRTFFDKNGNRLPKDTKMMLGSCAGGAVRLSETLGALVVCEGIETGLSLLSGLLGCPHTVWAALSTSGMKGLNLPPRPGKLIVAPDGDAPGREAAHMLAQTAKGLGWDVSLMTPPDGQDWNDVLLSGVVS